MTLPMSNKEALTRAVKGGRTYRSDGSIANPADGIDEQGRQVISGGRVERAFAVTPSDSEDLPHPTTAIYLGTAGDVTLDIGGEQILLVELAAGVFHPIATTKIYASGTTASEIVGAY